MEGKLFVYLAARYSRHPEMQKYAALLRQAGHDVTSRWILGDHELRSEGHSDADEWAVRWATEDLADLVAADAIVSFTEGPGEVAGRARGGRHVEHGFALAVDKINFVVGYRENVFHHLPQVNFIPLGPDPIAELVRQLGTYVLEPVDPALSGNRRHFWSRVGQG